MNHLIYSSQLFSLTQKLIHKLVSVVCRYWLLADVRNYRIRGPGIIEVEGVFYLFLGRKNVLLGMVGMNPLTVSIHKF